MGKRTFVELQSKPVYAVNVYTDLALIEGFNTTTMLFLSQAIHECRFHSDENDWFSFPQDVAREKLGITNGKINSARSLLVKIKIIEQSDYCADGTKKMKLNCKRLFQLHPNWDPMELEGVTHKYAVELLIKKMDSKCVFFREFTELGLTVNEALILNQIIYMTRKFKRYGKGVYFSSGWLERNLKIGKAALRTAIDSLRDKKGLIFTKRIHKRAKTHYFYDVEIIEPYLSIVDSRSKKDHHDTINNPSGLNNQTTISNLTDHKKTKAAAVTSLATMTKFTAQECLHYIANIDHLPEPDSRLVSLLKNEGNSFTGFLSTQLNPFSLPLSSWINSYQKSSRQLEKIRS